MRVKKSAVLLLCAALLLGAAYAIRRSNDCS